MARKTGGLSKQMGTNGNVAGVVKRSVSRKGNPGEQRERAPAAETAAAFLDQQFPSCEAAFLAGSASRGEAGPHSDLDIVILDHALRPYRASFFLNGWPIESFLHTEASCQEQFQIERSKGRPVLASMVAEGNLLKDNGKGIGLKELAVQFLARGPASLTADQIRDSRYFQFDLLDDFRDARSEEEAMITLNAMSVRLMDFLLRYNNQWSGSGKTLVRAFRSFDSGLSDRWFQALTSYYQEGDRRQVIRFVEEVYQPLGGRLFAGYSSWLDTGEPK